jgi:hypothetical protein
MVKPNAIATTLYVPLDGNYNLYWQEALRMELQQRFPGFTHWTAAGGWRDSRTGLWVDEAVIMYRVIEPIKSYDRRWWSDLAKRHGRRLNQSEMLYESCPCLMVLENCK